MHGREDEFWWHYAEIILRYRRERLRLLRKRREIEELLVWNAADRMTEIERLKRLFGLPYDETVANRRLREELLEERYRAHHYYDGEGNEYIKGREEKLRPASLLPQELIARVLSS